MTAHAVQLTPQGMGAIAVILLAGDGSRGVLQKILPENHPLPTLHKSRRATLLDAARNPLDDALLLCTAPDRYELHTHGGTALVDALLISLQHAGAARLTLDEALSAGLLGTTLHAELLLALSHATTLTAARLLASQTTQGLTHWATHWQSRLPSTSLWQLHSAAQWLLTRSHTLTKLLHPARIAIIGPPNAGKSTLANALLGRPIAITSNIPGTTRDWIDATTTVVANDIHVPVTLVDTAGVRTTDDPLEQQSIARTHQQSAQADLILLVLDASREPSSEELALLHTFPTNRLVLVANKSDLSATALPSLSAHGFSPIPLSAKNSDGLPALMHAILQKLDLADIRPNEPIAFTSRQQTLLHQLACCDNPVTAGHLLLSLLQQ